ncbi:MAG: CsbD family protein [Acidobacteriota bacterium]
MDKNRVKGTIDDVAGRAKRQAGEWTGDLNKQVDGAAQQVRGKAEKAWGNIKDAARNASENAHRDEASGHAPALTPVSHAENDRHGHKSH